MSDRDAVIAEYLEYAKERGRWWAAKHPLLRDDIMAISVLALVQALTKRVPKTPKAYISKCIQNAVIDLVTANEIIPVPRSEIRRRGEEGAALPHVVHIDEGIDWDWQPSREPPAWKVLQAKDVCQLLELTTREQRVIQLKIDGYTNEEAGLEFGISERAIRKILNKVKGRYLNLLHKYKGLLKPDE
jgi:RNA polymerase sigma factor (sigma-70 family)